MQPQIRVRFESASDRDIEFVTGLMQQYYTEEAYPFDLQTASGAISSLLQDKNKGRIWVARSENRILGYVVLTFGYSLEYGGIDAFIDDLYFIPEARGFGLGKQALALAESECRQSGVKALHLEVENYKEIAKDLYRKFGFVDQNRKLMTKRITL